VRVATSTLCHADDTLTEKARVLNAKMDNLLRVLETEGDEKTDGLSEKQEKEKNNIIEKVSR